MRRIKLPPIPKNETQLSITVQSLSALIFVAILWFFVVYLSV